MWKESWFKFLVISFSAFIVVIGCFAFVIWQQIRGAKLGGDFNLNHRGQAWNFSKNARELNLLYIGYAKCPDVCPLSLSHAGQAFQELTEKQAKNVQLIFVSVDFENDNPESVAEYTAQFSPSFVGLTGNEAEIRKAVDLFGASFMTEKNPKSYLGYSISHTDRLFFLDEDGIVVDTIPNPRVSGEILNKIKEYL